MTGLGYWRSPGNEVQVQVPVIDGLGLGAVTGVPVHLAAAGLGGGELDLVPKPLEQRHDGRPARSAGRPCR
jgi:hypothetical protein